MSPGGNKRGPASCNGRSMCGPLPRVVAVTWLVAGASGALPGCGTGARPEVRDGAAPAVDAAAASADGASTSGADRARADATPDAPVPPPPKIDVLTQRYGNARLGWNDRELTLTPAAVSSGRFGKLFARPVQGQIYTQPLVLTDVAVPGQGKHDLVLVATQGNKVYAFDAADPGRAEPLWLADLGRSVRFLPMEDPDFAARGYCACPDISPELGITATPVIDRGRGTVYLVSKHLGDDGRFALLLHALDVRSGREQPGSPVAIRASAPGEGDGSSGGLVAFDPQRQNVRAGLLLAGGRVYIGFTSHGDTWPYRGWVIAYDAVTLAQTGVFVTTPAGGGGAVWMSGAGLAGDQEGNVYFSTGNGAAGGDPLRPDLSHSVVKLGTGPGGALVLRDYFTAADWMAWNDVDLDFGSSAVLLLPGTHTLLAAGKSGSAYLLDRDGLGKLQPGDAQVVQRLQLPDPHTMNQQHAGFVYWEGPGGPMVFTWPSVPSHLLGLRLTGGRLEQTPALVGPLPSLGKPGGSVSVSSNGHRDGVVWTYAFGVASVAETANQLPGVLRAYDASDLRPLWDSEASGGPDRPGNYAKFMLPTVANGRVYVATFSDQLVVYGLRDSATPPPDAGPPPPVAPALRCGPPPAPDRPYLKLSDTRCLDPLAPSTPVAGLTPYTVNAPLWSDGAGKERFVSLPEGGRIHVGGDGGHFQLPTGAVLVKTFRIGTRRVETRLLVHGAGGWSGYSYAWNDQQTEATVVPAEAGAVVRDFPNPAMPGGVQTWTYPSRQDCNVCHIEAAGFQLGLELGQLDRTFTYPDGTTQNQLDRWEAAGMFDAPLPRPLPPPLVNPAGGVGTLEQRARSYLHANCAICHRPGSNFPGLDLRYATALADAAACDVAPAKGNAGVAGARILTPGSPETSVLTLRMRLRGEGQMPQLATRYVDTTAVTVIEDWIRSLAACR
jgi:uncharacterized repeat protein (TIGR03806 family)